MSRLVRSELRKLLSTRLWWGLLVGVTATSAALAVLQAAIAGMTAPDGTGTPGVDDPAVVRSVYGAGLGTAYLFALALGVITMAGEYRHQTITATLLSSPRRARVVVAKLVALSGVGLGYGVAAMLAGVVAGGATIAIRGGDLRLTTDDVPRSLGLSVVAVALWAVLGLGVGTLLRNQVVALLVSVGTAWIAEPLLGLALNALDAGAVAKFLPSQATSAIITPPSDLGGFDSTYLPWWGGVLVLLGYAVASAAVGAAVTLRRDVT